MGVPLHRARLTAPTEVRVAGRAAHLPVGVFPAARASLALPKVTGLIAGARPCVDVLDAALTNAGPVIYPAVVLLNAGAVEGGHLDVRSARTTTTGRRLIEVVNAERVATRAGWGYPVPRDDTALSGEAAGGVETHEQVSLDHRYVTEDAVLGLSLLESAARTASVDSPAVSGLLLLFGVLLGRTLSGHGRALEALGLGELLRREIVSLLYEGWTSPLWSRIIK
jgi:opine dehydrogenase